MNTKELSPDDCINRILHGSALTTIPYIPKGIIQGSTSSPPYYALRNYFTDLQIWGGDPLCNHRWVDSTYVRRSSDGGSEDRIQSGNEGSLGRDIPIENAFCSKCGAWRGELGLEPFPELYINHLLMVYRQLKYVLRDDGVIWVVIGDSFTPQSSHKGGTTYDTFYGVDNWVVRSSARESVQSYMKAKDIMGIPYMFAEAMKMPWLECQTCHKEIHGYMFGRFVDNNGKRRLICPNCQNMVDVKVTEQGWFWRQDITWCLSGGTSLYTKSQKGVMPMTVKDLSRLDPSTVKLWNGKSWVRIKEVFKSEHHQPLELVLRSGERIGCTPNHVWSVEGKGLVKTSELKTGDVLNTCKLPDESDKSHTFLPPENIGWFIGLYLAEGSKVTNKTAIQIACHRDETDSLFPRLQAIAKMYEGTCKCHKKGGNTATINLYGKILIGIIDTYICGENAKTKHLTNACWKRSNKFLLAILNGYLQGAGHYDKKNNRWSLGFTRNYSLERDLRIIAARLGFSLILNPSIAKGFGKTFPIFKGELRMHEPKSNALPRSEVVAINNSKGRSFWDIELFDEPHLFALSSGILTHNSKKNCMPESVDDRCTRSSERILMFSKSPRYYYDNYGYREPLSESYIKDTRPRGVLRQRLYPNSKYNLFDYGNEQFSEKANESALKPYKKQDALGKRTHTGFNDRCRDKKSAKQTIKPEPEFFVDANGALIENDDPELSRNARDVWRIAVQPTKEAHFACVDEGTEILTYNGWKNHDTISKNDKVATFDILTEKIHYHHPYAIHKYQYNGKMFRIKNQWVDQKVTPNHRVLCKNIHAQKKTKNYLDLEKTWKYVHAEELMPCKGVLIPNSGDYDGEISIGENKAALLGWIVTEGSFSNGNITIYQSESANPDYCREIEDILNSLNIVFSKNCRTRIQKTGNPRTEVSFYLKRRNQDLGWIFDWIDKKTKTPLWNCIHLVSNERRALYETIIKGDGNRSVDGRDTFVQHNVDTHEWFRTLCTHLGMRSTLSKSNTRSYITKQNFSHIHQSDFSECVTQEEYSGIVWCPELPHSNFIARRNGKIYITGNTYPEELVMRTILLSSSEMGCCPKCRSPWKRVLHKKDKVVVKTTWEPTCQCPENKNPVPMIWFDPFMGSGTTGISALKLGRNFLGTELNLDFIGIANKRLNPIMNKKLGEWGIYAET